LIPPSPSDQPAWQIEATVSSAGTMSAVLSPPGTNSQEIDVTSTADTSAVWVEFNEGDPDSPTVLGSVWNGQASIHTISTMVETLNAPNLSPPAAGAASTIGASFTLQDQISGTLAPAVLPGAPPGPVYQIDAAYTATGALNGQERPPAPTAPVQILDGSFQGSSHLDETIIPPVAIGAPPDSSGQPLHLVFDALFAGDFHEELTNPSVL
jgi:hypothetical protein